MTAVTVAILAGGQSRRMGTDKSFIALHGKPVFEHVLSRVSLLQRPTILITNSPEKYAQYELPMYADVLPDHGSLGGIYTALQVSKTPYTLCVACDMPFLKIELLQHLLDLCAPDWDIIAPRIEGRPEAMHTIYSKACIEPIQKQLQEGKLKATGFFDRVRYVDEDEIKQFDPDLRSFTNLNTPDDLENARNLKPSQPR